MADLNKRLMQGSNYVYPITKAENVIHLQKTIKEKAPLPKLTRTQPSATENGEIWLEIQDNIDDQIMATSLQSSENELIYEEEQEIIALSNESGTIIED